MKKGIIILLVVMLFSCLTLTAWAEETFTLSGKVSIPAGETVEDDIYVNIIAEKVGDSVMKSASLNVYEDEFYIPVGSTSGEYSIDLPQGNYVLTLYTYGRAGKTLIGELYYNNEKLSLYYDLQQQVEVMSNTRLNMTLPKATNTISGTLTFETPATEDTSIEFSPYTEFNTINYDSAYTNVSYYVPAGTKTLDYVIPVAEGSTTIDVYYNGVSYRIKNDNTLDTYWNNDRFFDTTSSYKNVNIKLKGETTEDSSEDNFPITINLAKPAEDWVYYYVTIMSEDGWWLGGKSIQFKAGEQSKTITIDKPYESFNVTIMDENNGVEYLVGGEYGITTDWEQRKIFTTLDNEIIVNFPRTVALTGTIARNGAFLNNSFYVDVVLDLDNGESYVGKAKFAADSSDGTFTIDVPFYCEGETGKVAYDTEKARGEGVAVTVGQEESVELAFADGFTTKYNVLISLSEAAPSGGVGVTLSYCGVSHRYYIPVGRSSVDAVAEFYSTDEDRININCSVASEDLGFVKWMGTSIAKDTTSVIGINKTEYVKVSGTVTVPSYVSANGVTMSMYLGTYDDGFYSYVSIPKGETSGKYTYYVPKGQTMYVLYAETEDGSGEPYYYEVEGEDAYYDIELTEDYVANIVAKDYDKMLVEAIASGDVKVEWITSYIYDDNSGMYSQLKYENNTDQDYHPVMILAVYDEYGKLVETQVDRDLTISSYNTRTVSGYFWLEINPDYTYKTIVVNNTSYLTPLLESIKAN